MYMRWQVSVIAIDLGFRFWQNNIYLVGVSVMSKKDKKAFKLEFFNEYQSDVAIWDRTKKTVMVEFTSEIMRSDVTLWSRRVIQYAIKLDRIHKGIIKGLPKVNMESFIIAAAEVMAPYLDMRVLGDLSVQQRFSCCAVANA